MTGCVEHVVCCLMTGFEALGGCLSALWSSKDTFWPAVLSLDVSGCKTSKSEQRREQSNLENMTAAEKKSDFGAL